MLSPLIMLCGSSIATTKMCMVCTTDVFGVHCATARAVWLGSVLWFPDPCVSKRQDILKFFHSVPPLMEEKCIIFLHSTARAFTGEKDFDVPVSPDTYGARPTRRVDREAPVSAEEACPTVFKAKLCSVEWRKMLTWGDAGADLWPLPLTLGAWLLIVISLFEDIAKLIKELHNIREDTNITIPPQAESGGPKILDVLRLKTSEIVT